MIQLNKRHFMLPCQKSELEYMILVSGCPYNLVTYDANIAVICIRN